MFLLSAHKVELEVQCDDDRWNFLEQTKNLCGLQRHLLILSVGTPPLRHENLHWDSLTLRFAPVWKWVPGIRSISLTILLYHLPQEIQIILMVLLLLFVLLIPQFRSSQIHEVSKFGDSTTILHKICQIPMNCQNKRLLAFVTVRETFVNSFPFPEKFLFCTDKTESIEWQDLTPRQRIGDCSETQLPHSGFCDLFSQVTKLFCAWNRCFASALSARGPCHLGPQAYIAISVFWEVSLNTVLPEFLNFPPLS